METQHIAKLLHKAFTKNAWHGPSVLEVLNTITAEQTSKRIGNAHTIIELVSHMTAWRIFTIKKLEGDKDYKVTDELNFPSPTNWTEVVQLLKESQAKLLQVMNHFPEEKLHEEVPHSSYHYTFYTMLHGIIQHDLYHLGQIVLITKALA
ncbi:MAG: DinB family protein [Cyclobacteriaceae bacterium]|nr:DinB family protein [Cyclobacteriaceae bacterium]